MASPIYLVSHILSDLPPGRLQPLFPVSIDTALPTSTNVPSAPLPKRPRPSGELQPVSLRERVEQQLAQKLEAAEVAQAADAAARHYTGFPLARHHPVEGVPWGPRPRAGQTPHRTPSLPFSNCRSRPVRSRPPPPPPRVL